MAVTANTTTTAQFTDVHIRELDFVSRYNSDWQALLDILGIMRPIRKIPGTKLVSYTASIDLQDGNVPEGDEVPLSQATVTSQVEKDLVLKKYRKRVTAESVEKYGADIAVQKTDDALLNELRGEVLDRFYAFALTGKLTGSENTFQMAVAMAIARVSDKFKKLRLNYGKVAVFANTLDVGRYLGGTNVSTRLRTVLNT